MANKNGTIKAFKVFKNFPRAKYSIQSNSKIQGRLSEEIQAEIRAMKEELKPPNRRETLKPKPIPPKYGLNRFAKKTTKEDNRSTIATLVNSVESLNVEDTLSDDDTSSVDDDTRMGCMVASSDQLIEVQATKV